MKKLSFILAYLLLTVPCLAGTITVDNDGPANFNDSVKWLSNHTEAHYKFQHFLKRAGK